VKDENAYRIHLGKLRKTDHVEERETDAGIILKMC
jgi:hypothetical protein